MKTGTVKTGSVTFTPHTDIIEACKSGDQKAQFQIYKLYYRAMYNISLGIVNDPAEAEDIIRESFLTAFEEIGTFCGTVSFTAWLKTIVQNRSIESLTKKTVFTDTDLVCDLADTTEEKAYCENDHYGTRRRILEVIRRLFGSCRSVLCKTDFIVPSA